MSSKRYVKTAAGHAEIQAKSLALSRPVRNLLLVINDSQPGAFWLQQIRGLADSDLNGLLEAGLIAEVAGTAPPRRRPRPQAGGLTRRQPGHGAQRVRPAGQRCGGAIAAGHPAGHRRSQLQRPLRHPDRPGQGPAGLVKGYRFALEVERAAGPTELQTLARRFAQGLRDDHGMAAVRQFLDALRAAG
jgi:hypothetical protein